MRFSDAELGLMKSIFAEDEATLQALRKVFFEAELSDKDKKHLTKFQSPEAQKLIRKVFIPEIDLDAPVGQMIDLLMTINFSEKTPEMAHLIIKARHIVIAQLNDKLAELSNSGTGPSYKRLANLTDDAEQAYINLTARNSYISHIEAMLAQINMLAGRKDETPEQTVERLQKDSAK